MTWSPTYSLSYMIIIFLPVISSAQQSSSCYLRHLIVNFEYKYYQAGDINIGGLISAHVDSISVPEFSEHICLFLYCTEVEVEPYKNILAFIFAIDEINKDPDLLPNITLGYKIFDTCGSPRKSLKSAMQIMSGEDKEAPNYSCGDDGEVAAFVANPGSDTNRDLIQFLSLYKITQINFGPSDPHLSDRVSYPTLYQMTPDDQVRYEAIVKTLKYFGWTWVGIITPDNAIGEMESGILSKMMSEQEICVDFIIKLEKYNYYMNQMGMEKIRKSRAKVIVVCGNFNRNYARSIFEAQMENITLIFHESWSSIGNLGRVFYQLVNCSLMFVSPGKVIPQNNVLQNVNPFTRPDDPVLEDLWYIIYKCLTKNKMKNIFFKLVYKDKPAVNCTEIYSFPNTMYDDSVYYVYTSVYVLAHVLNRIVPGRTNLSTYGLRQKLSKYMRNAVYMDHSGDPILFNERGKLPSKWNLVNWGFLKNQGQYHLYSIPVASFEESPPEEAVLDIDLEKMTWKNDRRPQSRCNDPCSPGTRKASNGGYLVCCYDCVPCSEGEVSNITDSESCHKCPKEEWPDEEKVICIPRIYEFLSYEKDVITSIFLGIVVFFSAVTLIILGIFIYYWDTPIVKANNRTVSFILLVSILLSFLSVFFFLGRPVDITCLLRQTSFGVFFTIGVSSVLAKTITVCIAFKASKPGSLWVKWISFNVSYYVVLVCSSVQVLICIIWMLVSPPYVEFDHHSYPGKIIIQCNEGSDIWFYSMLGYLGLLAAVSFVLAFMVRTLPDNFNEAKYITFSMLLFCSVWISMIPAYLSTRGKYMVAVEIFAILTSCSGILGCIFLPKMYIILLEPSLNSRKAILERN